MDNFQKELVMGFFLDDANLSTVSKSVLLMTDLIIENDKNLNVFNDGLLCMEKASEINDDKTSTLEPPQALKDYYEEAVINFSDHDYEAIFKAKKTTVKVIIKQNHIHSLNIR